MLVRDLRATSIKHELHNITYSGLCNFVRFFVVQKNREKLAAPEQMFQAVPEWTLLFITSWLTRRLVSQLVTDKSLNALIDYLREP